jgi:hypothetical protein
MAVFFARRVYVGEKIKRESEERSLYEADMDAIMKRNARRPNATDHRADAQGEANEH